MPPASFDKFPLARVHSAYAVLYKGMKHLLLVFSVGLALDAVLHFTPLLWRWRKIVASLSLGLAVTASIAVLAWRPNALSVIFALAGLYRAFNNMRIIKERMHAGYLRRTTRTTAATLYMVQFIVAGMWWAWYQTSEDRQMVWLGLAVIQALVATILCASTQRRLRHTKAGVSTQHYPDVQLPSITVAIPARNETEDLQECLEAIVASDYPKLEVLVLDDCSQDKRTPEIIRSFAQAGVRFLQGEEPKSTWLAKNQAYNQLAAEANGEIIVFCGVDVRMQPDTLRQLVTLMLDKHKDMVSVLPLRRDGAKMQASVVQAMRYWWELAPPRRLFNRPAVLSSCWAITRKALQQTGGFAAVTRAIVPESYFAKALIVGDRYSFMRANHELGIESVKRQSDQVNTAVRMRYPQLHRRPEQVFLVTMAEILFMLLPFVMAFGGWWLPITGLTQALAFVAAVLLVAIHLMITLSTDVNEWAYGLIGLPVMFVADIWLLHRSMWQYEFATIEWKGRNVCIPVMHTVPHLPKL